MIAKREQINIRSTVVISAVLQALMDELGRNKTDIVHKSLMEMAARELPPDVLLELLKKEYE